MAEQAGSSSLPSMSLSDEEVAANLGAVRDAIGDSGRSDVTIVAVTKGFDRSAIECASRLGISDIGENYAQELQAKSPMPEETRVHFIGRIQRNKVRKVADQVDLWHSVSRPEVVVEISKRSAHPQILIQVAAAGDTTKAGVAPDEVEPLLEVAREHGVDVAGLMTIGVLADEERTMQSFADLARLADTFELRERSMGMSGDYRDALAHGATMLRLGSALFGPRPMQW